MERLKTFPTTSEIQYEHSVEQLACQVSIYLTDLTPINPALSVRGVERLGDLGKSRDKPRRYPACRESLEEPRLIVARVTHADENEKGKRGNVL
jgi:hypothetical protein